MMWPSFTWAVWMSAFILLYATSEGIVNGQVAGRNVDKSLKVLNKLAARGSVWPEASAVAIQDLRSILSGRQDMPATPSSTVKRGNNGQSQNSHATSSPFHTRARQNADADTSSHQIDDTAQGQFSESDPQADVSGRAGYTDTSKAVTTPRKSGGQMPQVNLDQNRSPVDCSGSSIQGLYPAESNVDLTWPSVNFLPKDVPPMAFGGGDPFQGFDIPFWFGQDNYVAWMGNET